MNRISLIGFAVAILLVAPGTLLSGAEKERTLPDKEKAPGAVHTVQASVDFPSNPTGVAIQAEKRPGGFTIPKGSSGTKLKYSFYDPKSDYRSTKLRGSNIYSVTEHRYMDELTTNPNFVLPPGEYKFVVGGQPGASGSLVYTVVPGSDVKPPPGNTPDSRTRKPPPTDTSKTGTKREPLHPGGEGKRKVTVDFGTWKLDAWLTIDGNKLTLDFILPDAKFEFNVVKNTWRLEGTLEKGALGTTASGKSNYESSTSYWDGRVTRFKMKGTFTATLEGNVLTGSSEEHLEWVSDGHGPDVRKAGRWRIEGFSP